MNFWYITIQRWEKNRQVARYTKWTNGIYNNNIFTRYIYIYISCVCVRVTEFERFKKSDADLTLPKLCFVAIQLVSLGMGFYKLNNLGLLPSLVSNPEAESHLRTVSLFFSKKKKKKKRLIFVILALVPHVNWSARNHYQSVLMCVWSDVMIWSVS